MITNKPIRIEEHLARVSDIGCGGVATFTGVVRSPNDGHTVTSIHYDCYQEMAERVIEDIVAEVTRLTGATRLLVIHRIGDVPAGEASLLVIAVSPHRKEAFNAVQKAVDEIKQRVPIWKKEHYADAATRWV